MSEGPLHVLAVGAGIGGLACALALRRQGHRVSVFEKSNFASEIGAAVALGPNCARILRRLGFDPKSEGGTACSKFAVYQASGECISKNVISSSSDEDPTEHEWYLIHRAHLHRALKEAAIAGDGQGTPVKLFLGCDIASLNTKDAKLQLRNGQEYSGDLLIGADGVHSFTRTYVDPTAKPFEYGKNCYRWLAPNSAMAEDEHTMEYSKLGVTLIEWMGDDRRIIYYPCANNQFSNCVAFVPPSETPDLSHASKEALVQSFSGFGPGPRAFVGQAPEEELKLWQLWDMAPLPRWADNRLVLIGDACHPFTPFMGQGGTMAIEDGVFLAALMPLGTQSDEIVFRLPLLQKYRGERVNRIQDYARRIGKDLSDPQNPRPTLQESGQYLAYAINHDAWEAAQKCLVENNMCVKELAS